ncbi:glutathione synthetase [Radiomyces spectabilis]|uniref:glutathione synthetase n=1 Tax=Radiomyces spectabilis TaxID=64574 RepID=UPI00221EF8B7|nr:glutathione synthetase [Radiomyces spectabilis]KAI8366713.1 glutathione synthetase [Radiomyces spectabilis]
MDNLYQIYCKVRKEGVAQSASLGIHRCDYLLHTPQGASARTARIQQVEFNTVSASFGSLCSRTSELHKYLHVAVDNYANGMIKLNQLPDNRAIDALANGLACAWKVYGKPDARVLMIVQGGERNIFDQRWIEYNLLKVHGIRMMRRTMGEVHATATLDPTTKALIIDGHEIAVSYYRAAYGPEDFFGPEEWEARLTVERSASIKCPTVAYQLVGAKKVQQVLSVPGRLERYVDKYTADLLRESFAGLYPLDNSPEGIKAYQAAMENPEKYVLKPQREGGGHNFYGKEIVNVLNKLSEEERNAYILMDLIQSPPLQNLMVREGEIIKGDVISELGIYGIYVHDGENEVHNEIGGHLLRTKAHNTNEGGVAAGFAVIDSPLLID